MAKRTVSIRVSRSRVHVDSRRKGSRVSMALARAAAPYSVRVPIQLYIDQGNATLQLERAYCVSCLDRQALDYFRVELQRFMKRLDGVIITRDCNMPELKDLPE